MGANCNICSEKCFGLPGYHGSCCTIENRDYIIGPHYDTQEFVDNLSKKLSREINYNEVFVDYEEGKTLFPNKSTWQNPNSYPAFRVDFYNPRLPCIFYNTKIKSCTMYDIRPKTCREYECIIINATKFFQFTYIPIFYNFERKL
jgi:Fe-S-cluster containining protein